MQHVRARGIEKKWTGDLVGGRNEEGRTRARSTDTVFKPFARLAGRSECIHHVDTGD